jgi:hypothetical protein
MTRAILLVLATSCTQADTDSQVTGPTGDSGDAGITLSLTENADNNLSAQASVSLESPGTVHMEFWSNDVGPLRTLESDSGTDLSLDTVGMRADTAYTLQAVATLDDGTELRSETWGFTSGSFPYELPDLWVVSGEDEQAAITIVGPANDNGGPGGGDSDNYAFLVGVDRQGEVVWYFDSNELSGSADHAGELLDDGTLQTRSSTTVMANWPGGEESWSISTQSAGSTHHDAALLPNGNVVVLTQLIETHNVPSLGGNVDLVGDVLSEVNASGSVVWTWSTFDHLDTTRFPGQHSQTYDNRGNGYDWSHANSISYVADQDALLLSLRHQNQVLLIDRQTSEIIWTLGEDGDFELTGDGEWFNSQHAATMPNAGEILLYDNGNEKSGNPESRSARYSIDTSTWVAREIWSWDTDLFTSKLGDSDSLDNGNVLVCAGAPKSGDARVVEVSSDGEVVWEINVGSALLVYRAERVDWITAVD